MNYICQDGPSEVCGTCQDQEACSALQANVAKVEHGKLDISYYACEHHYPYYEAMCASCTSSFE